MLIIAKQKIYEIMKVTKAEAQTSCTALPNSE